MADRAVAFCRVTASYGWRHHQGLHEHILGVRLSVLLLLRAHEVKLWQLWHRQQSLALLIALWLFALYRWSSRVVLVARLALNWRKRSRSCVLGSRLRSGLPDHETAWLLIVYLLALFPLSDGFFLLSLLFSSFLFTINLFLLLLSLLLLLLQQLSLLFKILLLLLLYFSIQSVVWWSTRYSTALSRGSASVVFVLAFDCPQLCWCLFLLILRVALRALFVDLFAVLHEVWWARPGRLSWFLVWESWGLLVLLWLLVLTRGVLFVLVLLLLNHRLCIQV